MPTRKAQAHWEGNLTEGKGEMSTESSHLQAAYSFPSRFESGPGTNPEELIGAALAGCFSMALANALSEAGFTPTSIDTQAGVEIRATKEGFRIPSIELMTHAVVPEVSAATFEELAHATKEECPVSRALTGTEIRLTTHLSRS